MDFKALGEKIQVPKRYDLKIDDIERLRKVNEERGYVDALYTAFLAGWIRRENKAKNDARKAAHQDQG